MRSRYSLLAAARKSRPGFTLVEILVAAFVLSIFMTAVYKVYRGVTTSFQQASWAMSAQIEARNGLNFLREELQRASPETTIGIGSVVITAGTDQMTVNRGTYTTNGELAKWFIGIPSKNAGGVNEPGCLFESTIKFQGGKVFYKKAVAGGTKPAGEAVWNDKVIMSNVASISISTTEFEPGQPTLGTLVGLAVEMRHPDAVRFPHTKIIEHTAAKVEVEVP